MPPLSPSGPTGEGLDPPPAVWMRSISKSFGAVRACDDVSLRIEAGRVLGLLGPNGAGKSTLMKILIGIVAADRGEILIDGRPATIDGPQRAGALGIAMVHQHFSLIDALTVWENVLLGDRRRRIDRDGARAAIAALSERYGLEVDPDATVGTLTAGQRQRVEIIKCLRREPRVLIFDEPTSVLTPAESEHLFRILRTVVQDERRAVALISHRLDEVRDATDDIVVMRDGRIVGGMPTGGSKPEDLARMMVGREVRLRTRGAEVERRRRPRSSDEPVLRLTGVTVSSRRAGVELDDLDLAVHPGEVVGLVGAEGHGQRALAEVLSSLRHVDAGSIDVAGRTVVTGDAGSMAAAGVAVIPEDRHDSGCVVEMSVAENLILSEPEAFATRGVLDRDKMRDHARRLIEEYEISCSSPDAPMWTLSGGNQQRVVVARELSSNPKVLVACQPSRGLDVGVIEFLGDQFARAADRGTGILLISSELDEVLHLSDRIVVMHRGTVVGEMENLDVDLDRLEILMNGT